MGIPFRKIVSLLLLFLFITAPLQTAFASDEKPCSCVTASESVRFEVPVYLFVNDSEILAIAPLSENFFVWAYVFLYTHDAVGDITQIVDYSTTTAKVANFGYDHLYRLTYASTSLAFTSPNYLQTWGYNAIGNISSSSAIRVE